MNQKVPLKDLNELISKVDNMKKQDKMDLSADQDLTIAIMHLVSIEEHFVFSGAKTGKTDYYDLVKEVREMRKALLKQLIPAYEGEVWCISKHLLGASMRLLEVGTKQLGMDHKTQAYELFQQSYDLYSLFWGLNMNLIVTEDVKKIDDDSINKHDKTRTGLFGKLGTLVKKAIDCCIE